MKILRLRQGPLFRGKLKLIELRKMAAGMNVDAAELDQARDSDDPVPGVVALIVNSPVRLSYPAGHRPPRRAGARRGNLPAERSTRRGRSRSCAAPSSARPMAPSPACRATPTTARPS
jgi:hypothetical protein